jgi:hypothetical protein
MENLEDEWNQSMDNWDEDLDQSMEDWRDDWSDVMSELGDKFEELDADFNWPNSTNWNETDWENIREDMEDKWETTFDEEDWDKLREDLDDMRIELIWEDANWDDIEDKIETVVADIEDALADVDWKDPFASISEDFLDEDMQDEIEDAVANW